MRPRGTFFLVPQASCSISLLFHYYDDVFLVKVASPSASFDCCRQFNLLMELQQPQSCDASESSSEVFLSSVTSGSSGLLDFAKDMKQHDDTHVEKREDQHGLRGHLEARRLLLEEGKLISRAVLGTGSSIRCILSDRLCLRSGDGALPCKLFFIHFTHSFTQLTL